VPIERVPRFRNAMLSRILRLASDSPRGGGRRRGVSSVRDVRSTAAAARRCIVKARFVPMNQSGRRAAALHLTYIERDGVEQDGSPGRLYGPEASADIRVVLRADLDAEKRQFRFIVSPEEMGDVDLTSFTRRLVAQMEHDLGRKLVWGAVNHWNTDNPHVHIVVRGLDADGHDLTIDGRYIATGVRSRASAILTNDLGPRTALDLQDQLSREVHRDRFTSLDKALQALVAPDGSLLETWIAGKARITDARLLARLATLERLALVRRVSAIEWRFEPEWVHTLRRLGQANDVIKRLHVALPGRNPNRFVIVDTSVPLPPVEGVVRRKGLHDELAGHAFAVVEAFDGRAFYLKLDLAAAERLKEQDVVRIVVEPDKFRPGLDAELAAQAARTGGSIAAHDLTNPLPPDHVRRLAQLERSGVITRIGDTWNIPKELVDRVAQHAAKTPPPLRVRAQRLGPPLPLQIRYPGPTWLDALEPKPGSNAGHGAQLAEALHKRTAYLKSMGISAIGQALRDPLTALEAHALGTHVAADRKLELVSPEPGTKGLLSLSARQPSGIEYAVITNPVTKQICVLPATKRLRMLDGHEVRIWRNKEGRVAVSEADRSIAPERKPGKTR
jgi:type IV secretory pathway VirD2 relaxase